MNIKRSYFKLLIASAGVGLFLANCTFKESDDDGKGNGNGGDPGTEGCTKGDKHAGCACPDALVGYQVCSSEGVYGSCVCPDTSGTGGTSNNEGGTPSAGMGGTTDTDTGGAGGVAGGAGGEGGEGGAGFPAYEQCETCLADLCQTELEACLADEQCFSADGLGGGEYDAISTCIEGARAGQIAKRDAVRGCGVTFGASSDPDNVSLWAPQDMAATTTNLLNCMATSHSQTPNADWANDPANFPNDVPAPWPADSCAKLACTSAK